MTDFKSTNFHQEDPVSSVRYRRILNEVDNSLDVEVSHVLQLFLQVRVILHLDDQGFSAHDVIVDVERSGELRLNFVERRVVFGDEVVEILSSVDVGQLLVELEDLHEEVGVRVTVTLINRFSTKLEQVDCALERILQSSERSVH